MTRKQKQLAAVGAAVLIGGGSFLVKTLLQPAPKTITIAWDYNYPSMFAMHTNGSNWAFDVEFSTNLSNWTREATVTNYSYSNIQYTSVRDFPRKFFRVGAHWTP